MEWFIATRPWSFPASIVGVLIGSAIAYNNSPSSFSIFDFIITLIGGIVIHTAGNLTNTYYDWKSGLDQKATADDRTLFDFRLTPNQIKRFFEICFLVSFLVGGYFVVTMSNTSASLALFLRFLLGAGLAFGYTGGPQLKYIALGDVAIFLCFGPLLVESTYFIQMHHGDSDSALSSTLPLGLSMSVILFSVPIGLLTEAILHVNNTRDIVADKKVGAKTVAQIMGPKISYYAYCGLFAGAYIGTVLLSLVYFNQVGWKSLFLILPLVTLPMSRQLFIDFKSGNWKDMCPRTGQYGFLFGVLFSIGIYLSGVVV